MKRLISLKSVVALVLILTLTALIPLQALAAANNGKYVSEVYVAYGKDAAAAEKVLTGKGYTPVEGNLNEGGDTFVMLGYKTTDNIRDSITDIAVMNMDGDFSTTRYTEVLQARKVKVAEMMNDFMSVIREYRANLKAGKAKATVVHDILNRYIDDDTGMRIGDLLNSETIQDKVGVIQSITAYNPDNLPDLLTIFMQGNSYIIATIETLLAISADTADNTWIDRFAQTDYDSMLDRLETERPDLNTDTKRVQYLDGKYGDLAMTLASQAASLRSELIGYEQTGLDIIEATEEEIKDTLGDVDSVTDETVQAKIGENTLEWTEAGVIYEALKNYEGGSFKKGELLDFFLEEADEDDAGRYIPMAASLSDGQRGGMEFVDLKTMIRYAFLDPEELEKQVRSNDIFKDIEDRSVYSGINRDLFNSNGSIAYTDGAKRQRNVVPESPEILGEEWMDENLEFIAVWAMTILSGVVGWGGLKLAYRNVAGEVAERQTRNINYWDPDLEHIGTFIKVFRFVCIFFAVIAVSMTIYRLSQTEEVKLDPIPKYFVDAYSDENGEAYELYYEAAQCNRAEYNQNKKQGGSSADLCADEGRQWLALYVSKNSMAGNPLTPDFKVEKKPSASGGRKGSIHMLREKGAINLAEAKYRNYSDLYSAYNTIKNIFTNGGTAYVFYQRSDTAKTYDESAGNMTASAFNGGIAAVFGFGGVALGAVLGAAVAVMTNKVRKKRVIG